ncbi:hypothetical protein WJX84_003172 [Apatococcus fuscideae]
MKQVVVKSSALFGNRFGNFRMQAWIGKPFGTKVYAKEGGQGGWVYLLRPTAELWTQVLKHRTQILYAADISMVCIFLELKPGSTVLESGTGSGSLTTSLARAVGPEGAVHTFEFHEQRCQAAAEDFQQLGLDSTVHLKQRDIEGQGFPAELAGQADAVFLDLPGPWKVVSSAAQTLKPNGRFCSFSPCIEQVQQTCLALGGHGFHSIRTMECLLRPHEVRSITLGSGIPEANSPHNAGQNKKRKRNDGRAANQTAQPTPATVASPAASLAANGGNLSTPPLDQGNMMPSAPTIANSIPAATPAATSITHAMDTAAADATAARGAAGVGTGGILQQAFQQQQQQHSLEQPSSSARAESISLPDIPTAASSQIANGERQAAQSPCSLNEQGKKIGPRWPPIDVPEEVQSKCGHMVVAQPSNDARGHTGYLTFASKGVPVTDVS